MRRLLNRVHDLLYSKENGAFVDEKRFAYLVTTLDQQLQDWYSALPPAFRFSFDTQPAPSQFSAFLRQRYFTCRSVIFRPYLNLVLEDPRHRINIDDSLAEKCKICLDACILHILNLQSFSHTVLVDTWICALSMACAMLVILAAHQIPSLTRCIRPDIGILGPHLHRLLSVWIEVPGHSLSPSVELSLRLIAIADVAISTRNDESDERRHKLALNVSTRKVSWLYCH